MTIAHVITQQLGKMTLMMLGAKDLTDMGGFNGLRFRVRGSKTITHLQIALAADDTYVVTAWKVQRADIKQVEQVHGVYVDSLHQTIETLTGLYTRM